MVGGFTFAAVVCGGYGGFQLDVDCNDGARPTDRVFSGVRDNEALVVSHLLFANDTLIFCGAQSEKI